ncbi:unnamed protein product [Trichobilharzia regenti]|nr:unnamed protein product [Trichobilharzia regenti]
MFSIILLETSHTKSQDSLNNGVDQTSSKPSSLASDDDDDDDVIIVDSPDTQGSGVVQSASNVDDSQQNPATSSAAAEEEEKLKSTDESDTHSTDIQSERRQKLIARLEVLLVVSICNVILFYSFTSFSARALKFRWP